MAKMGRPKKKKSERRGTAFQLMLNREEERALAAVHKACQGHSNGTTVSKAQVVRQSIRVCLDLIRKKKLKPEDLLPAE